MIRLLFEMQLEEKLKSYDQKVADLTKSNDEKQEEILNFNKSKRFCCMMSGKANWKSFNDILCTKVFCNF